jgi:exodeoxyribonuclease V
MIRYSPDQSRALDDLARFADSGAPMHALAGPAGSGKTTVVADFAKHCGHKTYLTATTNKAARVAAAVQGAEPRTVHSLLGLQPVNDCKLGRTVLRRKRDPEAEPGSILIVDEASMVDADLLQTISADARKLRVHVLFVGDAYQLPPVFEATAPAFDRVPTSHLTTVHRQALDNPVLALATEFRHVLDGHPWPRLESRGNTVAHLSAKRFMAEMTDAFRSGEDARALAWTNRAVRSLNAFIRLSVRGSEAARWRFIPGERFIVNAAVADDDEVLVPTEGEVVIRHARRATLALDAGALAGEVVMVTHDDTDAELFVPSDWDDARRALSRLSSVATALQQRCKAFPAADVPADLDRDRRAAWRAFFDLKRRLHDLRPPFASTVHKGQGSTYGHVFVDVGDIGRCTHRDMVARLMYVAISRASQCAALTGELPARLYGEQAA